MPIYKLNEKNKDGKLKYKVRVNYVDANGAKRQLTRVVWGSAEAKELEKQLVRELDNKTFCNTTMTVSELFADFLNDSKQNSRATTVQGYEKNYRLHIKPYIDHIQIRRLNTKNLSEWKTAVNQKGLSLTTRKNIYSALRTALNYAVKMDYLPVNPLNKVGNFKDAYYQKEEMQFYTPEEFQLYKSAALAEAQTEKYYDFYVFFCIAYYTGCRKGEIHALRWNCIDFNKQTLHVRKSINQKQKGGDVETPPKNQSSIRILQIPQPLIDILLEHKSRQQSIIPNWKEEGFVCGYYMPLRDTSIQYENEKYAKAAGVKKIRIHDFRHSHVSVLINNGVAVTAIAKRIGHSTAKETLKTYAHLFPGEEEKAINVLNNIV